MLPLNLHESFGALLWFVLHMLAAIAERRAQVVTFTVVTGREETSALLASYWTTINNECQCRSNQSHEPDNKWYTTARLLYEMSLEPT